MSLLASDLVAKRFELLSELIGNLPTIGFIINSDNPNAKPATVEAQIWGRTSGRQIIVARASTEGDLESAFAALVQQRVGALVVSADGFFTTRRKQLVGLAARHAVPSMFPWPDFGGRMAPQGPNQRIITRAEAVSGQSGHPLTSARRPKKTSPAHRRCDAAISPGAAMEN